MKILKIFAGFFMAVIAIGLYYTAKLCGLKDEDLDVMPVSDDAPST